MSHYSPLELLRALTPGMILGAIRHRLRAMKRRSDASARRMAGDTFRFLDSIDRTSTQKNQITLFGKGGAIRIAALAGDLIQIRFRQGGDFSEPFSYAVEKPESAWKPPRLKLKETDTSIEIATKALSITLGRNPFALTVRDAVGRVLLEDRQGIGVATGGAIRWQADLGAGSAFYGLGEKASALNHAGKTFELWNTDPAVYDRGEDPIYLSVPFVLALRDGQGVGLFFDNTFRARVDLGAASPGKLGYQAVGGEFRLYLMTGSPQAILERFTELTGRMKLPPLWLLGFHQSRWSYYPQERVMEIAQGFRQRHLPCDAIHLDIHYMDGYRCFTWDEERFPDPRRMLDGLHAQGFKAISIIDPGIKVDPEYRVYREGLEKGFFIRLPGGEPFTGPVWPGDCHFTDYSNPAAREWWGGLYRTLTEAGLDAFWNDMNEAALITGKTGETIDDSARHAAEGTGAAHAELHNVYGLLMDRATIEGLDKIHPQRRNFILSRSGWAGLQRYASHWTADNRSTWDHLRLSIQMVLNLGLSGIAMTGADVGGFTGSPTPELFARWMEAGAFLPFYRVHCMQGAPDQEPWAFGEAVEAISRTYLEWRYRLLPYLYTAVWQAADSGLPIARAMSFAYPGDAHTLSMDDQYLLGDSLLVAPVLDEKKTSRRVYLPAGEWFDFWTQERYSGGQTIRVNAPLDVLPVFARAGSIVPLWPLQEFVGQKEIDELTLRAYGGSGEGRSLLYEDDGERPDYHQMEAHRLSEITLGGGALAWRVRQGSYTPSYRRVRVEVFGLDTAPARMAVRGGRLLAHDYAPDAARLVAEIETGGGFILKFG